LDIGNKVAVVEVRNSIRVGIMIIVAVANIVTKHPSPWQQGKDKNGRI
jgi:hypothetical protein